jgi:hypothetical protein
MGQVVNKNNKNIGIVCTWSADIKGQFADEQQK